MLIYIKMVQLWVEAVILGLLLIVAGTIVSWIVSKFSGTDLPPVCKDWNKNYIMEISLFLTGVVGHLFFEFTGANKWYCKNGYACRN